MKLYVLKEMEIKPCPFCGAKESDGNLKFVDHSEFKLDDDNITYSPTSPIMLITNGHRLVYSIFCKNCGSVGPIGNDVEDAINLWNSNR